METVFKHTAGILTGGARVGDADAANPSPMQLHGSGGMFSTPGLENPFISTVIRPRGIGSYLPAFPTLYTNPIYSFITEIVKDGDYNIPDYICGDAQTASMKTGSITAAFGRLQAAIKTVDLGQIALVTNSSERTDVMMMGNLLPSDVAGIGYPSNVNEQNMLNNVIKGEMVTTSFMLSMMMNKMTWQGNPASASAHKGFVPFKGLDMLIKTGHVDSIDGATALPSVDSLIVDAGNADVETYALVEQFRAILAYLEDLADGTVGGAQFAIVMRPKMWAAISDVWAQKYVNEWTSLIAAGAGVGTGAATETASRVVLDAASLTAQRDALKASMMLPVGGKLYPVILDHGIKEDNHTSVAAIPAGSHGSSVYFLPLSFGPGLPSLYWEYLDWTASYAMAAEAGLANSLIFWTDGGRFAWTMDQAKMCINAQVRTEPRLVLRTPQLAARIDKLTCKTLHLFRQPHDGDDGYVGGGVTTRP